MHQKVEHDKWRMKLAFAFIPRFTEDVGLIWLCPYIKHQRYITGLCMVPDAPTYPCYMWKTIARYGNLP